MRFALGPVFVLVFASEIFGQPEMPKGTWLSFNAPGKPPEVKLVIDQFGNGMLNVNLSVSDDEVITIVNKPLSIGELTELNQQGGSSMAKFSSTVLGREPYYVTGFYVQKADRILFQIFTSTGASSDAGGENPCEPHSVVLHD